jgi:phosphate starvation-inducible PhoH-like protein
MAKNSGKTHRAFPAKKASRQRTRAEQALWRKEKESGADIIQPQRNHTFKEIKPLNYIQGEYLTAIENSEIIFGIGSAGTGKTYIAASYAAGELFYKRIDKIILTRPNVETGRGMGFLPGELDEKYAPYLQPFDQVFTKALGAGFYEYALKTKNIDPKPLGFMRGASFENCIILVDEAQNLTKTEFKMLLSRIGKNCKVILSGDPKQTDITDSGLLDATKRLSSVKGVEVVVFRDEDIVRSQMCKQVILAYNN